MALDNLKKLYIGEIDLSNKEQLEDLQDELEDYISWEETQKKINRKRRRKEE